MPKLRLCVFAAILFSGFADVVLSSKERCDMCVCHVVKTVLLLNCSDAKMRLGDNSGMIHLPYPDSYAHYTYETIEAHFERNRIKTLARLSLVDINSLYLVQNEITAVSPGTFIRLGTLKILSLKDNELQTLHAKSFEGLSKLEFLDLSQNMLTNLPPETFTVLKSLKTLLLSNNKIENMEGKTFAISTLQTLDISNNFISQLGLNTFENAVKLTTLNLTYNNISTIDNYVFLSLGSLQSLDLSFNRIVTVETSAFSNLKSLTWLSLSSNLLKEVPEDLEISADLQVLHLEGNGLEDLGDPIRQLMLKELYVQSNFLQNIDVNVSRLRVLNVSLNLLTSFPTLEYPFLEVLDVSGNLLSTVPEGLTGLQMPALRWLRLDSNPIKQLHFPIVGKEEQDGEIFVNLTWVSVSNMTELEELKANAFSALASPCGECSNGMEEGGVEFEALAQYCNRRLSIKVAHNPRLVKIDMNAFKDVGMCSLDLSYNALSFLDEGVTNWEKLEATDLQGNPWDCTCHLQWVLERVLPRLYSTNQDLLIDMRCNTPVTLRNKRLVHFYKWKKKALCNTMEQLRAASEPPQEMNVTFGSTAAMLGVSVGLASCAVILVVVGIVLTRRNSKRRRMRNRRL